MALFNLTSDGVQLLVHTILSGTVQETFDTKFNLYFDNEDFSITQDGDKSIVGFSGSTAQLIAVTNGNNVGYMLAQEDPNNHSAPGNNAIDLSTSDTNASGVGLGAEGEYSFAIGYEPYAEGDSSFALGDYAWSRGDRSFAIFGTASDDDSLAIGGAAQAIGRWSVALGMGRTSSFEEVAMGNNTLLAGNTTTWVETDRAFVVGIGTGSIPKDGLSIFKNGKVYADSLDIADIIDNKQLVTKEYVDANAGGESILQEITLNGNTGAKLSKTGWTDVQSGIGNRAVDLSEATTASGATGFISFAVGHQPTASGDFSNAIGYFTQASGEFSTAIGDNLISNSLSEVSLGTYNTNLAANSATLFNSSDRILSVGIGENVNARADALEIFKNGTIYADELDLADIVDDKQIVTKEYVDSVAQLPNLTVSPVTNGQYENSVFIGLDLPAGAISKIDQTIIGTRSFYTFDINEDQPAGSLLSASWELFNRAPTTSLVGKTKLEGILEHQNPVSGFAETRFSINIDEGNITLKTNEFTECGLTLETATEANIVAPVVGTLIVDGTALKYYNGTSWTTIAS